MPKSTEEEHLNKSGWSREVSRKRYSLCKEEWEAFEARGTAYAKVQRSEHKEIQLSQSGYNESVVQR